MRGEYLIGLCLVSLLFVSACALSGVRDYDGSDKTKCSDPDGRDGYISKSTVISGSGLEGTDSCIINLSNLTLPEAGLVQNRVEKCSSTVNREGCYVEEFYCDGDNLASEVHKCPEGCKDGACASVSEASGECTDYTEKNPCLIDNRCAWGEISGCIKNG